MKFEDILDDVGGYGKYQKNMILFFILPVSIFPPLLTFTNYFLLSVPDHWCNVPNLSHINASLQRQLISSPNNPSCYMRNDNYTNILEKKEDINNSTLFIPCDKGWSYDKTNYESTAATKWNLVCDKSNYVNLVLTLQNVGGVIGTPIYSVLSDKFGRKIVYALVAAVAATSNLACSFVEDFSSFAVLRTIQGSVHPTIDYLPYILVMEIMPLNKRTQTSSVWNFSWVTGMCLIPLVVYLSKSWKVLCWINSAAGCVLLLFWSYIPESPRWLLLEEKYEETQKIMLEIAGKNKCVPHTEKLLMQLQVLGAKMKLEEKENKQSLYSLIKFSSIRKYFLILIFCCFATHTSYWIIQYNIGNLEINELLVFFLLAIAEFPGCLAAWITMEHFGRKWSAVRGFVLAGVACAIPLTGLPHAGIVSSVIVKLLISALFMVVDQQICEIYPTNIRSFGMGATKSIANGLSFALPYVVYLNIYSKAIPFVFISLTCFAAGVLAYFLPETLNKNLPQTLSDAEESEKK